MSVDYVHLVRLQKVIYLNSVFSIVWFSATGLLLLNKIFILDDLTKFLSIGAYSLLLAVEVVRLFSGYSGNIAIKLPELSIFLMWTALMNLPLITFFLFYPHLLNTPTEVTLHVILLIFSVIEILLAYRTFTGAMKYVKSVFRG